MLNRFVEAIVTGAGFALGVVILVALLRALGVDVTLP
jgi:hypothetical protein